MQETRSVCRSSGGEESAEDELLCHRHLSLPHAAGHAPLRQKSRSRAAACQTVPVKPGDERRYQSAESIQFEHSDFIIST